MASETTPGNLAEIIEEMQVINTVIDKCVVEKAVLEAQALESMRAIGPDNLFFYKGSAYYVDIDGNLASRPLINALDVNLQKIADSGIFPEPGAEAAEFGPNLS